MSSKFNCESERCLSRIQVFITDCHTLPTLFSAHTSIQYPQYVSLWLLGCLAGLVVASNNNIITNGMNE